MPHLELEGRNLSYLQLGEGPDLVMLHGLASHQGFWFFNIAPALGRDFHVTLYDMRGHGLSDMPPAGYTTRVLADDLREVLAALGMKRVHLVGHSFGGATCLHFAALHPDAVASLTLVDCRIHALQPYGRIDDASYWDGVFERAAERGLTFPPQTPKWLLVLVEELHRGAGRAGAGMPGLASGEAAWKPGRRSLARWNKLVATTSLLQDLQDPAGLTPEVIATVDVPTFLLYGDQSICMDSCRALESLLPNNECVVLPGRGHFFPMVEPGVVIERVGAFAVRRQNESNETEV